MRTVSAKTQRDESKIRRTDSMYYHNRREKMENKMKQEFKYEKTCFEHKVFGRGIFIVPHGILDMTSERFLSKSAGILLIVLLHFENRKTITPNEWFTCDDREFYKTKLITRKTLVSGRVWLKDHSLLDVEVGTKRKATKYRIKIPGVYYYKKWFRGSKRNQ